MPSSIDCKPGAQNSELHSHNMATCATGVAVGSGWRGQCLTRGGLSLPTDVRSRVNCFTCDHVCQASFKARRNCGTACARAAAQAMPFTAGGAGHPCRRPTGTGMLRQTSSRPSKCLVNLPLHGLRRTVRPAAHVCKLEHKRCRALPHRCYALLLLKPGHI